MYCSEILPTAGVSATTFLYWVLMAAYSFAFLYVAKGLGIGGVFLVNSGICVAVNEGITR